jgi:hypothetical protein
MEQLGIEFSWQAPKVEGRKYTEICLFAEIFSILAQSTDIDYSELIGQVRVEDHNLSCSVCRCIVIELARINTPNAE